MDAVSSSACGLEGQPEGLLRWWVCFLGRVKGDLSDFGGNSLKMKDTLCQWDHLFNPRGKRKPVSVVLLPEGLLRVTFRGPCSC